MPLLLIAVIVMGLIFWFPSGVVNLREQETLWPLVGIALFCAFLIYRETSKAVGLTLFFIIFHIISVFTPESYRLLLVFVLYGYFYYAVVINSDEIKEHKNLIYNLICILALLNVVWMFLQANGIYVIFYPKKGVGSIETGFFANRNEVSVFLAATLPLFFRGYWHIGIIPIIIGIIIAQTTNGAIGATLALSIYGAILLYRRGWPERSIVALALIVPIILIGLYVKFIHRGGIEGRLSAFQKSFELIQEKPFWGWGMSQGKYIIPLYLNGNQQDPRYLAYAYGHVVFHQDLKRLYIENPKRHKTDSHQWVYLHNDYEQWVIEAGLIGLFFMFLVIGVHAVAFFRTREKDVLAGLSVAVLLWSANAFFTFQIGRFDFLAVLFMALIMGQYRTEKKCLA